MINTTQNIATKHHLEHSLKANISCFQVNYYDNNGVWQQTRHIAWTEDSRITNIVDKSYHSYYTYDDGGERVLKITGPSTILDINADMISYQSTLKNVTLYTSPYLVAHNKGYTKHFYAGSERVCAAIGEGGLNSLTPCIGNDQTLKNTTNALFNSTIGSMGGRFLLENQSCLINTGDVPNELLAEFENVAVNVKLSSGVDASIFHTAINKYCSQNNANSATYYYHSDHLGSASWITNASGSPVQHLQYMPYGEPFVNERISSSSYEERYTFTGKERDSETGYSYFGARFYDSDLMTGWLSVDPQSDKFPNISPYAYCNWNPVKIVDPNGEFGIPAHRKMVSNALENTSFTKEQKKQIIKGTGYTADITKMNDHNVHFDSKINDIRKFQNIKKDFNESKASFSKNIKNKKFEEAGIDLHTVADFYAHSNYVELYLEYAKSSNKEIKSADAIPLFSDVYSNPDNYSGFLEILNDKLTTGIYNSMKEDFFSRDSKSHKQMNHDSPFSNMGRKKYNGIKAYKFARSLAEREINTIINSLNQN